LIFEVLTTTIMGAISLKAYLSKSGATNDSQKLNQIFNVSGLNVKDGQQTFTTQLLKRKVYEWGTEYRYRIPLGRSFDDYLSKLKVIQDGLNNKRQTIKLKDLKELRLDKTIMNQLQELHKKKLSAHKEVELSYDGLLKIKVYNEPLPNKVEWTHNLLKVGSWSVPIGMNRNGTIYHDFDKRKHLIVAGATGFGKSVSIKTIITSLLLSKPNDVSFSLIDLKSGSAFSRFKNCKQVVNFGTDNKEAGEILKDVQWRMNEDYKKIVDAGFEDVSEAGINKRHFLILDESADLVDDKDSMEKLTDIVRKGRGAGYYVIYATQYPSAQAIPMQIKRNIPARLCFVLDSSTASMTVLDTSGAENLPEIAGRGIYKEVKQKIIQTPYLENRLIDQLIKRFIVEKKEAAVNETTKRETGKHIAIFTKTGLS
jgi:DNA segregation ATPase FtsK/SpoIIIE, S-DNA-T family